ncbi:hypothetical protein RclHR1_14870002 [Rhizophagus clarus]|uniref:Uncharacterized protein n=1 Tax=Rhizophagus clarus TaxID=94130 RepID=A0A2Z6QDR1_9GLOM|nr:hypothetical protein RclHR1_14870002 [Rhizophagus clarus]
MIFGFAKDFFYTEKDYYLESDVIRKTDELYNLMKKFADTHDGTDEITKVKPIKLHQLIYTALGIRGCIHKSIVNFTKKLNNSMDQYRVIKDLKMKKQQIAQYHWFKHGDKVSKIAMKTSLDDDEIDDFVVELCTFHLSEHMLVNNEEKNEEQQIETCNEEEKHEKEQIGSCNEE